MPRLLLNKSMQCKRTFVQCKCSSFSQCCFTVQVNAMQTYICATQMFSVVSICTAKDCSYSTITLNVRVKPSDILEQLNDYSGWEYSLWIVYMRVFCMFFQEARGDTLQSWMVGRERTLIIAGDNLIVITIVTVPVSPSPPLALCHFVEFHLCWNIIYSAIWYPTQFS